MTTTGKNLREYDTGEEVFHQGERSRYMCVLVSGAVSFSRKTDKGEKMQKIIDTPNEFFGELSVTAGLPRDVTVVAIKPSKIIVIDESSFERIILTNGKFALRVIKSLARHLTQHRNY